MNILVITQLYPQPDDTGDNKPTRTVEYFAKEWVQAGHKVVVIHCPSKFPIFFYWVPDAIKNKVGGSSSNIIPPIESRKKLEREALGIHVYRMPMLKMMPGMGYSKGRMQRQAKEIASYLEQKGFVPELVMGHFANPSTELVALLAKHYGAKSSMVFHHDCTERNVQRYRLDVLHKEIGAIGARSVIEAHDVKRLLHLQKEPFLCYSGVPNDAIDAAERTCNKHDFSKGIRHIYVGSLIARKHLDAVIRALLQCGNPNAMLEVVGGGPEEEKLKALTKERKAGDRVRFIGRVPRSEVLDKMKQAQVFTLISDGETFGMVYIEAMLQGCLVIASKGGGFDGIIQDGVNGFLCEPGNAEMLASIYQRIEQLSEAERNAIGQRAIDTALNFSEKEVAENYLRDVMTINGML